MQGKPADTDLVHPEGGVRRQGAGEQQAKVRVGADGVEGAA